MDLPQKAGAPEAVLVRAFPDAYALVLRRVISSSHCIHFGTCATH